MAKEVDVLFCEKGVLDLKLLTDFPIEVDVLPLEVLERDSSLAENDTFTWIVCVGALDIDDVMAYIVLNGVRARRGKMRIPIKSHIGTLAHAQIDRIYSEDRDL